jgi:NNP family nitrate/nitrite transporter-like MFS transporter
MLLVLAFLVGFAGNLFSVGIAWNSAWYGRERQGFALGVFGAGNVGASVTKLLIGPPIIARHGRPATYFGILPGWLADLPRDLRRRCWSSWRPHLPSSSPPRPDGRRGKPIREMLAPLKHVRVWRFSLYYAAVFGAYVALSAWLPKYYVDNFGVELQQSPPAHRDLHLPGVAAAPVGGWFSDRSAPARSCTGPSASCS